MELNAFTSPSGTARDVASKLQYFVACPTQRASKRLPLNCLREQPSKVAVCEGDRLHEQSLPCSAGGGGEVPFSMIK